jgi:peptidoglycan L-alanyl-D-glutamate endopeptidase CwlK
VFEGIRTVKRQKKLVREGRSWTMKSKHITGNAVDLVPWINGKYTWEGKDASKAFAEILRVMKIEAEKLDCTLICGAEWRVSDKPHYQLSSIDIGTYSYARYIR